MLDTILTVENYRENNGIHMADMPCLDGRALVRVQLIPLSEETSLYESYLMGTTETERGTVLLKRAEVSNECAVEMRNRWAE